MSIGKFRPAEEKYVGVPVTELDEKDSKVLEESQKTPVEETKTEKRPSAEAKSAEAKTAVNLRLGPGLTEKILCVLYPGEKIKVQYYNAEWYKLKYKGTECYVRKEYVTTK